MIEINRPDAGAAGATPTAPSPATAGALLRAAREAQGLHIAALATAIKVTPRKVESLEGDRLHELPDVTFARALAKTICRQLKLDSEPVLALLPPSGTIALEPASRIQSTPYRDRSGRADQGSGYRLGPLVWGAVALLVAAAAVLLLPASGLWGLGAEVLTPAAPDNAVVPAAPDSAVVPAAPASAASAPTSGAAVSLGTPGMAGSAPALDAAATSQPTASSSPAPVALFSLASPGPLTVPASMVTTAAPPAASARTAGAETVFSAPPPSAGVAPAVSGVLVVTTTDVSWVEVRDAKGQVLLSETVQPGRSIGVDGTLPFRLLVGNAAATQLVFMGRTVDVMARSRENVARFELQ